MRLEDIEDIKAALAVYNATPEADTIERASARERYLAALLISAPALLATAKAAAWRPINEAPKDGRWVLAFGHNGPVVETMQWLWNDDMKSGDWYWWEGDCPRTQPTHWRPIGPLPVEGNGQ